MFGHIHNGYVKKKIAKKQKEINREGGEKQREGERETERERGRGGDLVSHWFKLIAAGFSHPQRTNRSVDISMYESIRRF